MCATMKKKFNGGTPMSYLNAINDRIELVHKISKTAICLYDSHFNQITYRDFRCGYCRAARKILRSKCDKCDAIALKSTYDHEYVCPMGLKETVVHLPLKTGMAHAIMGKYRHADDAPPKEILRDLIAKGNPLDLGLMLAEYEKVPIVEHDEIKSHEKLLLGELKALRDGNHLRSFENEVVLQTIKAMRQTDSISPIDAIRQPDRILRLCIEICDLLPWCRQTIERAIRDACEERFSDFVRERNMVFAEDLLSNSDMSIKDIARTLGYDFMYFQTLFKALCNVTPKKFRKNGFRGLPHPPHLPF